jgi:methionyl-tRNA formyltransferase
MVGNRVLAVESFVHFSPGRKYAAGQKVIKTQPALDWCVNRTYAVLGAKRRSEAVVDRMEVSPDLILSLAGLGDRGATYSEYEEVWETVDSINSQRAKQLLADTDVDIVFVISWPELLEPDVLEIPSTGCIGRHISMLPKRRGRAPVAWALIHGLAETGVTLFWLDEGVDSGDIAVQESIPIDPQDEAHDLYDKATATTVQLVDELVQTVESGEVPRRPQDESEATYTHPRRPDMGLIDWSKSAVTLHDFIRAQTHPYPGTFTYNQMDKIRVWHASVAHQTAVRAEYGAVVDRTGEDHYVVQTGEGTLAIEIENLDGNHPMGVGSRLGCHA